MATQARGPAVDVRVDDGVVRRHAPRGGAPWIGVYFECCRVYSRIYRTADHSAYAGTCPRCAAAVRVPIGPQGTDARMFRAG